MLWNFCEGKEKQDLIFYLLDNDEKWWRGVFQETACQRADTRVAVRVLRTGLLFQGLVGSIATVLIEDL